MGHFYFKYQTLIYRSFILPQAFSKIPQMKLNEHTLCPNRKYRLITQLNRRGSKSCLGLNNLIK